MRIRLAASTLAFVLILSSASVEAVQRVFVASYGNDANVASSCGFANPCRGFAAAMTAVDPGGEVVALDAAGYGTVTITKSVTITANPGYYAGIAASSGNAVTIATAGVNVILRGLNINGVGAGYGIVMTDGASLTVENCIVSHFLSGGIFVVAPARVRVADSVVRGNSGSTTDGIYLGGGASGGIANVKMSNNGRAGLLVHDAVDGAVTSVAMSDSDSFGNNYGAVSLSTTPSGKARVNVVRSTLANNAARGLYAFNAGGANASAMIGNSSVSGNGIGLDNTGAVLESQGNNVVRGNGTEAQGTITNVGGM